MILKILKKYEELGANLKNIAYNGNTLIHQTFNPGIISFLVNERELDINKKNYEGETAIHRIDDKKINLNYCCR